MLVLLSVAFEVLKVPCARREDLLKVRETLCLPFLPRARDLPCIEPLVTPLIQKPLVHAF